VTDKEVIDEPLADDKWLKIQSEREELFPQGVELEADLYAHMASDKSPVPSKLDCFVSGFLGDSSRRELFLSQITPDIYMPEDMSAVEAFSRRDSFDPIAESEEFYSEEGRLARTRFKDELVAEVHKHDELAEITHANLDMPRKLAHLAGDLLSPYGLAYNLTLFGAVGRGMKRAGSEALLKLWSTKSCASLAEWVMNTAPKKFAIRYLGSVAKSAGEFALFDYVDSSIKGGVSKLLEIPEKDIGSHTLASALVGGIFGLAGGPFKRAKFLRELSDEVATPHRVYDVKIEDNGNQIIVPKPYSAKYLDVKGGFESKHYFWSHSPRRGSPAWRRALVTHPMFEVKPEVLETPEVESGSRIIKKPWGSFAVWGPRMKGLNSKFKVVRLATEIVLGDRFGESEFGMVVSNMDAVTGEGRGRLASIMIDCKKHLARFKAKYSSLSNKEAKALFFEQVRRASIEQGSSGVSIEALDPIVNGFVGKVKATFRKFREEAIESGLLDKGTSEDYYPQYYSLEKIKADMEGWTESLRAGLRKSNPGLSDEKINTIINDITETVYWKETNLKSASENADGSPIPASLNYRGPKPDGSPMPASLKQRKIKIEQSYLVDYLEPDILKVMKRYIEQMSYKVAEKRNLAEFGYKDYSELISAYMKEIGGFVKTAEEKDALVFIESLPRIAMGMVNDGITEGIRKLPGGNVALKFIDVLKNLNVSRAMGGLGLTAIEDLAQNASKFTLFQHIEAVFNHAVGGKLKGISKEEAIKYGFCCDRILEEIRSMGGDVRFGDAHSLKMGLEGKAEVAMDWARHKTSRIASKVVKASGIMFIDDMREIASASESAITIANIILGKEKGTLGKLRGQKVLDIKRNLEKYTTYGEDNVPLFNTELWEPEAARNFWGEVRRRVRFDVVRPDIGDVPAVFNTPLGPLVSMFYRYTFGVYNSVLLPMIRDGRYGQLATWLVFNYALTMLRQKVHNCIAGYPDKPINHEYVFKNLPIGPLNFSDYIYRGINGELKFKSLTRVIDDMISHGSLQYGFDLARAIQKSVSGKPLSNTDIKRNVKLTPYSNLPYFEGLLNHFADSISPP
jgi:hypothetical protein